MTTPPISIRDLFLTIKSNPWYSLIALSAMLLQLIVFKLLYPYGDFFSDSYSYMFAAATHQPVSIWPIGYSKFIGAIHLITPSDTALIAIQYLFVQLSTLLFYYSILVFFNPSSIVRNIIFIFLFFNPLILYICNYVSSDGLFLALSVLWITQLLWILYSPNPYHIVTHALLVAIAFTVRYNAMYYPLITAIAFILSRFKLLYKMVGIILPFALVFWFVNYTQNKAYVLTGTKQFSVFGGWQLANNALYMYPYIQVKEPVPDRCQEFHKLVNAYFNSIPEDLKTVSPLNGAFYIKYPKGPMKQYLLLQTNHRKDTTGGVASWGTVAPTFGEYGKFLIKQHPLPFTKYFLLPNLINYWLPPLEKLEVYNLGQNHVGSIAKNWFHYPNKSVRTVSYTAQRDLLGLFPTFFSFLNIFFIGSFILWIISKGIKNGTVLFKTSMLLIAILFIVNGAFAVLASPIVFRYQVFPMIILFTFSLILIEQIQRSSKE